MTKHFQNIVAKKHEKMNTFAKSKQDLNQQLGYSKKHAAMHAKDNSSIYRELRNKIFVSKTEH